MKRLFICILALSCSLLAQTGACPVGSHALLQDTDATQVRPGATSHYFCATAAFDSFSQLPFGARSFYVRLNATAALTAGQVVKIDTANDNAVVVAVTTDTGAGIPAGVVLNNPGAGGVAFVALNGVVASTVIGTGTCARGNFVIVDTTTAGRVKCTATYTAGTVIGKAMTTGSGVGTAVTVLVNPQ